MASTLTLFRRNGACSFIPHVILNEIGVPFETIVLDFDKNTRLAAADGSFTHEQYQQIHPSGFVPALKVDGEVITELPAITNYIASLKADRQLLGRTLLEQAKHEELMCWLSGSLHAQGFAALWRSRRFTDSQDPALHEGIQVGGRKRIMEAYARLEEVLTGPHAIGGQLTVVDVAIYNYWRWGALRLGIEMGEFKEGFPKVTALAREVEGVPSVRKTLEAEGLPFGFQ